MNRNVGKRNEQTEAETQRDKAMSAIHKFIIKFMLTGDSGLFLCRYH
jgi:hypothetical protein